MTIAIVLKVNDGLVFAADSRTSFLEQNNVGKSIVVHAYDNANKIFNLHKGLPIGMVTAGVGSLGPHAIATLAKDFRRLISGDDPKWRVDPGNYTIEQVANLFHDFIYNQHYLPAFGSWPDKPTLIFWIGGYSSGASLPETWSLRYNSGNDAQASLLQATDYTGASWDGDPDPLYRLVFGYSLQLPGILLNSGLLSAKQVEDIITQCKQTLQAPIVHPAMPIQDAIGLAEFMVETTMSFTKYIPGGSTVGGPVEIAAVTKHEGFKWVYRKHYFDGWLNPS